MLSLSLRLLCASLGWLWGVIVWFWSVFLSNPFRARFLRASETTIKSKESENDDGGDALAGHERRRRRCDLTDLPNELLCRILERVVHPSEGGLRHMRVPCSLVCSAWYAALDHQTLRQPLPCSMTGTDLAVWREYTRHGRCNKVMVDYVVCCFWCECAWFGHLELLQWANRWKPIQPPCYILCTIAALRGHTNILRWMKSIGCEWHEAALYAAVQGGHTSAWLFLQCDFMYRLVSSLVTNVPLRP